MSPTPSILSPPLLLMLHCSLRSPLIVPLLSSETRRTRSNGFLVSDATTRCKRTSLARITRYGSAVCDRRSRSSIGDRAGMLWGYAAYLQRGTSAIAVRTRETPPDGYFSHRYRQWSQGFRARRARYEWAGARDCRGETELLNKLS